MATGLVEGDKVALLEIPYNNHLSHHYGKVFIIGRILDPYDPTVPIWSIDQEEFITNWYRDRLYKVEDTHISLIETSPEYEGLFE